MKVDLDGNLTLNIREILGTLDKESLKMLFENGILEGYFNELIIGLCKGNVVFESARWCTQHSVGGSRVVDWADKMRSMIIEHVSALEHASVKSITHRYDVICEELDKLKKEHESLKLDHQSLRDSVKRLVGGDIPIEEQTLAQIKRAADNLKFLLGVG